MDGGAWSAAVHGVAKSWTRLSDFSFFLGELKRSGKARGSSLAALKKKKEKTILSGDEWLCLPGTHILPNFLCVMFGIQQGYKKVIEKHKSNSTVQ